jgi:hypothetical protein
VTTPDAPVPAVDGESRWPVGAAIVVAAVLTVLFPKEVRAGPPWLLPGVEGLLLIALTVGHPARMSGRSRGLRAASVFLVAVLVFDALWSTGWLIDQLINGGRITESAGDLLDAAVLVWLSNNLAFALVYWEFDGGGPAERLLRPRPHPDLLFPQLAAPHVAPAGWRPRFIDYLYLAFTNATAFSPTDVMPLTPWPKMAMASQSLISLALLGLVIGRAVNVLQ